MLQGLEKGEGKRNEEQLTRRGGMRGEEKDAGAGAKRQLESGTHVAAGGKRSDDRRRSYPYDGTSADDGKIAW